MQGLVLPSMQEADFDEEERLPPVPGVDATRQLETLQRLHAQKVRALMSSIHMLKEQLSVAKAASKEHRR